MPFSFFKGFIASIMYFKNKSFKYFLLFISVLILSGCSVWENFTTYFNLYYNTSKLFEDTETEILSQQKDLFSTDPIVLQGNSKNSLIKVVEKCSNILQFDANSSYVDEALMMLGKSFYYQINFKKIKRQFEQLIATNQSDEDEVLETNFWIAKCQFALKEDADALKAIEQIRKTSVEQGNDKIINGSYVEEIKYYLRKENYTRAISLATEFAEVYDDNSTRAEIYFELGKLYTLVSDNENAILAYQKVFDYSPDFDLEIEATIRYSDALREGGQYEKALDLFNDIRSKDKFKNSFNEIDLEIGKTFLQLGRYDEAFNQFKLVDSTYKNTPFAAAANFEIGELYRTHLADYDSATYFYTKSVKSNPTKDYAEKARSNSQLFNKYQKLRKEINKFNRQLYYSENPDVFIKDSAAYTQDSLKILNDYLEKKELADIWKNPDISTAKIDTLKYVDIALQKHSVVVKDSLSKIDSLVRIGLYSPLDTVGLKVKIQNSLVVKFINDSLHTLDSLISFGQFVPKDTIGLRQKIANDFVQRIQANLNDSRTRAFTNLQNQGQVRLDTVKFKRNPPLQLKISIDSAKTVLAKNSLELGNMFLAELNVPDSAYALYITILNNYPVKTYYPNTLYALGSYYLTINNTQKADSLFRIIYDNYKDRSIVNAAASKLNLSLIDLTFDPAKAQYSSAEKLMLEGNYDQSLYSLYEIYNQYPKSPLAPQALFTSGWILENNLFLPDSAASVYDTLVAKYPRSIYVKNVAGKLSIYKQEQARIQKAVQDSLANLQKLVSDSTIVVTDIAGIETDTIKEKILAPQDQNANIKDENLNVAAATNVNNQKKLEPLWDPRKHFQ
jgi:tetratricopeptide (TPR) repeat protein